MGEFAQKETSTADGFGEVAENATRVGEAAHELGQFKGMFPVLQAVSGPLATVAGINQMRDGHYVDGGLKTAGGLVDTAHAAAELAGKTKLAKGLGKAGPIIDGVSAVNHFRKGDYYEGTMDTASTILDVAAPEVAPAFKVGGAIGDNFNATAAEHNEYGGNRTLSQAGGETARDFREAMEASHGRSDLTNNATAAVIAEKTVANTVDGALTAIAVPPMVRELLAKEREAAGEEGGGGIAGMGFGIEDVVGLSGVENLIPGYSKKKENNGPTYLDMLNRFNGNATRQYESLKQRNDATQRNAATAQAVLGPDPGASPYTGMYEHTDHVRK